MEINKIAKIKTDFKTKFGLPRQSGIIKELKGEIVFEKQYRNKDSIRGMEGFSHLWLIWGFSQNHTSKYMPTVRPPKLGGNEKMGVFATRSPFRPNSIGLSLVKIENIILDSKKGPIIEVSGVDMVDNTPIYDIKPYLPYADSVDDAKSGFVDEIEDFILNVEYDGDIMENFPLEKREILLKILGQDPRPSYIEDENRIYGFVYCDYEIKFKVKGKILTLVSIEKV